MQFIPTFSSQAVSSFLFDTAGFTAASYGADSDFNDLMRDALEDREEERAARPSASQTASSPLLAGPYNPRTSANGVTFTLDEIKFTKTELAELRTQLLREGAPEDALSAFDLLADQPDGAMLGQVLASLQLSTKASLTDEDAESLTALLNQIDPSGVLADQTADLLRNGHSQQALAGISQALAELDDASEVHLSRDDLHLLGRALNLPENVLSQMKSLFGDAESLSLTRDQMGALLAPAQDHLGQLALRQQKLDDAADATVKLVVSKARDRMKKEREAESHQSREVEQSKTLIKETVQEDSNGTLTEALRQSGDAKLNEALSRNAQGEDLPDGFEHMDAAARDTPQRHLSGDGQNGSPWGGQNGKGGNGSGNDAWSSLLSRVKTGGAATTATAATPRADGVMGTAFAALHQLADPAAAQNAAARPAAVGPYLSPQAAQQVQNGLLSALHNGGTRLDLQLNPVELGSIAITLQSRNGEVSACLRVEKPETLQAMQQQAESIRLQLEQQGVKIDKIEVQLQNQGDQRQDGGWEHMQQHNTWAEQHARQAEISRLRNLAAVRNGAETQAKNDLAQSLQDTGATARYAARRLNLAV